VVGGTGRDRVRGTTLGADFLQGVLPAFLEADPEAGLDEFDVSAHDPGEQDVTDPVIHRIGPVHPALLNQAGLEPQLGSDGGDLAGVVGLHSADRDEVGCALGERIGY